MQPKLERRVPPPPRAELSDIDRRARSVERAPDPRNAMPFSRGNTTERVDSAPEPKPSPPAAGEPAAAAQPSAPPMPVPESENGFKRSEEPQPQRRSGSTGVLADAIRNVQKYAKNEGFVNLQGKTEEFGPAISFDSKGVEFGPWIRRFIAQVKRNWFVPYAAMTMKGHVVITFNVHKDGRLTDLAVVKPSSIDAFNNAAYGALASSNPTVPLPPEYPANQAFFTVTFFYNEEP
jgi:TonB family protein